MDYGAHLLLGTWASRPFDERSLDILTVVARRMKPGVEKIRFAI
jgi:hypothetical protein